MRYLTPLLTTAAALLLVACGDKMDPVQVHDPGLPDGGHEVSVRGWILREGLAASGQEPRVQFLLAEEVMRVLLEVADQSGNLLVGGPRGVHVSK